MKGRRQGDCFHSRSRGGHQARRRLSDRIQRSRGSDFGRHPYDKNVIKYRTGADLLIHEVCIAPPQLLSNPYIKRVVAHHTSPREAGQVFSLAKPKLAVYSHIAFLRSGTVPRATVDDSWRERADL